MQQFRTQMFSVGTVCKEFVVTLDFKFLLNTHFQKKKFKQSMQYRYLRLEPGNFFSKRNLDPDSIEDMLDGSRYNEIDLEFAYDQENFFSAAGHWMNVPYCLGYDGGEAFKVSKESIWPMVLMNMGLPPDMRVKHDNIIMLGFYIGKHPDLNIFLDPFVSILENWLHNGIKVICEEETFLSKGGLLFTDFISDGRIAQSRELITYYHKMGFEIEDSDETELSKFDKIAGHRVYGMSSFSKLST